MITPSSKGQGAISIKHGWPPLVTSKGLARAAPPPPPPLGTTGTHPLPSGQVSKYTLLGAIAGHSCSGQQRDGDFVLRRRGVCLLLCLLLGVWRGETLEGRRESLRLPQLEPRGAGLTVK